MQRALELAARGDYRVGRNPRVGAVLARRDVVLAEGWHQVSGEAHAEAAAFAALGGASAEGATLYVSLEPCAPFAGKRTPSCADAILAAGVSRVVVATLDPHAGVAGRSLDRLRAEGLSVEVGLLGDAARALNGSLAKAHAGSELPYVTAKWAMSLDGKIACHTGHSQWISGEASRREVHRLRGEVDAIAVGIGTALADDPQLTRRGVPGRDPLRVVFDASARLPPTSRLAQSAHEQPVLLFVTPAAPPDRVEPLRAAGVEVLEVPEREGSVDLRRALVELRRRDVQHLLVEGGGTLLASLFRDDLVDRVQCFLAPRVLGGASAPTPVGGLGVAEVGLGPSLRCLTTRNVGEDVLIEGHVHLY